MIETEHQRQAAKSWIRYWNQSLSAGEQSWQGREEALEARMQLRARIKEHDQRADAHRELAPR